MKILYVSSHDLVGQQFNGYLLMVGMQERGVDARMFVHNWQEDKPGVLYHPANKGRILMNRGLSGLEKLLSLQAIFPIHSIDIRNNDFYQEADIVHLQLIHASQFFSLLSLPKMGAEKKLLLTLHDPWMLTGHCVHPMECERWKIGCGAALTWRGLSLSVEIQRPLPGD